MNKEKALSIKLFKIRITPNEKKFAIMVETRIDIFKYFNQNIKL